MDYFKQSPQEAQPLMTKGVGAGAEAGAAWDVCFVLDAPVVEEEKSGILGSVTPGGLVGVLGGKTEPMAHEKLVQILGTAGLETSSFLSCQKTRIYVKVRASKARLLQHAEATGAQFTLVEAKLEAAAVSGFPALGIAPIVLGQEFEGEPISQYRPFQFIAAPYDSDASLAAVYDIALTSQERIRLTTDIVEASKRFCGGELNTDLLVASGEIVAYLPLHCATERAALQEAWFGYPVWRDPYGMPFDAFRDYFGEKQGLLMKFIAHTCGFMFVIGIFGLFVTLYETYHGPDFREMAMGYAAVLCVWTTAYSVAWQRRQRQTALMWGTCGLGSSLAARIEFEGQAMNNPFNGKPDFYFPSRLRSPRLALSALATFFMIALALGFIAVIMLMGHWETIGDTDLAVLNAVGIQIFAMVYEKIALSLTSYENWRTESEYESTLIKKLFVFNFFNSFTSLFFTIFIETYIPGWVCMYNDNCLKDLSNKLFYLLFFAIITQNVVGLLVPVCKRFYAQFNEGGFEHTMAAAEMQFLLVEYNETIDQIQEYSKLVVQWGYVSLFSAALPYGPLMAAGNDFLLLRLDAYQQLSQFRRLQPAAAEHIGPFAEIIVYLGYVALLTNCAIVVYMMPLLNHGGIGDHTRDVVFMITISSVVFVTCVIKLWLTGGADDDLKLQAARQNFICQKIVNKVADDDVIVQVDPLAPDDRIADADDSPYYNKLNDALAGNAAHMV